MHGISGTWVFWSSPRSDRCVRRYYAEAASAVLAHTFERPASASAKVPAAERLAVFEYFS